MAAVSHNTILALYMYNNDPINLTATLAKSRQHRWDATLDRPSNRGVLPLLILIDGLLDNVNTDGTRLYRQAL